MPNFYKIVAWIKAHHHKYCICLKETSVYQSKYYTNFEGLPDEVILKVLSYLETRDVLM